MGDGVLMRRSEPAMGYIEWCSFLSWSWVGPFRGNSVRGLSRSHHHTVACVGPTICNHHLAGDFQLCFQSADLVVCVYRRCSTVEADFRRNGHKQGWPAKRSHTFWREIYCMGDDPRCSKFKSLPPPPKKNAKSHARSVSNIKIATLVNKRLPLVVDVVYTFEPCSAEGILTPTTLYVIDNFERDHA